MIYTRSDATPTYPKQKATASTLRVLAVAIAIISAYALLSTIEPIPQQLNTVTTQGPNGFGTYTQGN